MLFVSDQARDELAKSTTILQMMIHMLDFECNKHGVQPELIGCRSGIAMISVDPMGVSAIIGACEKVNQHFKRTDGKFSCSIQDTDARLVECFATGLADYHLVS